MSVLMKLLESIYPACDNKLNHDKACLVENHYWRLNQEVKIIDFENEEYYSDDIIS